jgi:hypothetical protein
MVVRAKMVDKTTVVTVMVVRFMYEDDIISFLFADSFVEKGESCSLWVTCSVKMLGDVGFVATSASSRFDVTERKLSCRDTTFV